MKVVIDIDENTYTRLFDNGTEDCEIAKDDLCTIATAIRKGKTLELCKNCISRKDIQDYLAEYLLQYLYSDVRKEVEDMPNADVLAQCIYNDVREVIKDIKAYIEDMPSIQSKTDILDKIRNEIANVEICGQINSHTSFIKNGEQVKNTILQIIDKYQ